MNQLHATGPNDQLIAFRSPGDAGSEPTVPPCQKTITASAGTGGSISPSGSVVVSCGATQAFTITPESGYVIDHVDVDGVSQGILSTYEFTDVQADHTIQAYFALVPPCQKTITASAGTGGSISPSGSVVVSCGATQAFTITPESGYVIDHVDVDGVSQGILSTYTFTNVQADHTIQASFVLSSTNMCSISGYVTDDSTGDGVSGIRIEIWDDSRTTLLRSGITQSDGFYSINHISSKSSWVDAFCPDQGIWDTTSSLWYDHIHLNPGNFCSVTGKNFQGHLI